VRQFYGEKNTGKGGVDFCSPINEFFFSFFWIVSRCAGSRSEDASNFEESVIGIEENERLLLDA